MDELELALKTMNPKEALHSVIDGNTVVRVDGEGGFKIYMEDNIIYFEGSIDKKQPLRWHLSKYPDSQWIVEMPITKPKFTIDSLVYNADGTIGRVVEDKGLFKGVRKYSVKFNAVRDTLRTVDETELSAYVL